MLLVLLPAALAGDPPVTPTCDGPATLYLADVAERGDRDAYLCLITEDRFHDAIVAAIKETPTDDDRSRPRYTRALALALANQGDKPWKVEDVRLLAPSDRRLIADAIKARHGRKSPAPEHDEIFQLQPWYRVDDSYSDNVLTPVELDNIAMANNPPPETPPDPPPAAPVMQPAEAPPVEQPPAACGCRSGADVAPIGALGALVWLLGRRRRA